MRISLSEAKGRLTDLVRRAEAGDEIILTRHGHPTVRLVPVAATPDHHARRHLLETIWEAARRKRLAGEIPYAEETAARSQDFLYDEEGLPG